MEHQPQVQKPKKKLGRIFIIIIIAILIIAILGWAGLTRAGFIPNYFNIQFLHAEQSNPQPRCFQIDDLINCSDSVTAFKPVVYLYPEQKQRVNVQIYYKGNLTVSYPEYHNGWDVVAHPDGKIINLSDNKEYSYLFWEGIDESATYDLSSGFVVKGSETVNFLQEKLAKLGLTAKEYNEFIVYWLPQMQDSEYNLIHFATQEEYNDRAILDINPKPDSVLRIFMTFKKIDNEIKVNPQEIKPFNRNGFVVVEWGGTEIN